MQESLAELKQVEKTLNGKMCIRDSAWIEKIKAEQPELREVKQARYQEEYLSLIHIFLTMKLLLHSTK